jgi:hypothetical protein
LSPFFAHLASKFEKSTNMTKFFIIFQSKKVSKNAEFHADFESVEKVVKKLTKRSYKQNNFDEHE